MIRHARIAGVMLACLCVAVAPQARAQAQAVPDAGLRAEMSEDWAEAVRVYRAAVQKDPTRADLWVRLGDIHARTGDRTAAAQTYGQAADIWAEDAALQIKASQAYAVLEDWGTATKYAGAAVRAEPENVEFLRARAQLANAAGDTAAASDSYRRLVELGETDTDTRLAMLQAQAWNGELDAAATGYAAFLDEHPAHREGMVGAVRVELWRGDYQRALEVLDAYEAEFGQTEEHQQLLARVWARANRHDRAMAVLDPLRAKAPDDYDVAYTEIVALVNGRRPRESVEALARLEALGPDRPETRDMRRFVMTRLRTNGTVYVETFSDSDDIDIYRLGAEGEYALAPNSFIKAGYEYQSLHAKRGTGLEHRDGSRDADYRAAWVGGRHRISHEWAADVRLGGGNAEGHETVLYGVGAEYTPEDNLVFGLRQERLFHLVSPRAASLGIYQDRTQFRAHWDRDLEYAVDFEASIGAFSDDNDQWLIGLAPRRAMLRTQHYNLDVGVSAMWYGFDDDLNNGYFDPGRFQRYMATSFHYWKISDDDGVSLVLAAGASEDDQRNKFTFAGEAILEGTFGIYRDWQLVVRGTATFTDQSIRNVNDYNAFATGFYLTRRF